jgi:hypothetical protein
MSSQLHIPARHSEMRKTNECRAECYAEFLVSFTFQIDIKNKTEKKRMLSWMSSQLHILARHSKREKRKCLKASLTFQLNIKPGTIKMYVALNVVLNFVPATHTFHLNVNKSNVELNVVLNVKPTSLPTSTLIRTLICRSLCLVIFCTQS